MFGVFVDWMIAIVMLAIIFGVRIAIFLAKIAFRIIAFTMRNLWKLSVWSWYNIVRPLWFLGMDKYRKHRLASMGGN